MPKLAESRFVTGPKDKLAVADVYEVTDNAVRNRAETLLDELAELLGGLRLEFDEIVPKELVDVVEAILSALKQAVQQFIDQLAPGLRDIFQNLDRGSLLSIALSDFPLIWDLNTTQLRVKPQDQSFVDGVDTLVTRRKNELGQVTPEDEEELNGGEGSQVNLAAQQLVYSRITEELIRRDLSDALPEVLGTITHPDVLQGVKETALPVALNPKGLPDPASEPLPTQDALVDPVNSEGIVYETSPRFTKLSADALAANTVSPSYREEEPSVLRQRAILNEESGVREGLGGMVTSRPIIPGTPYQHDFTALQFLLKDTLIARIRSRYPVLVTDILKGVTLPRDESLATYHTALVDLLDAIDPQWAYAERNGTLTTNLNVFRYASYGARTLFVLFGPDDYRAAAITAPRYSFQPNWFLLKQQYPYAAL